VNIIGFNSPEWFIANMGAIAAGGLAAGIYTTNNPEACKYIAHHSEAEVVVCENKEQLNKFVQIAHDFVLFCLCLLYVLSACVVLSCLALFCLVLSCLFCLALSFTLSWLGLPRFVSSRLILLVLFVYRMKSLPLPTSQNLCFCL
jgi:hypothetical protein